MGATMTVSLAVSARMRSPEANSKPDPTKRVISIQEVNELRYFTRMLKGGCNWLTSKFSSYPHDLQLTRANDTYRIVFTVKFVPLGPLPRIDFSRKPQEEK